MNNINIVFDIDEKGNLHGLWTEEIDLFSIGRIINVRKASNVEFNQNKQKWEILSLEGEVLHEETSREAAIKWEIAALSPGGEHYDKN